MELVIQIILGLAFIAHSINANPNLVKHDVDMPFDFINQEVDMFKPTCNSRCELYKEGPFIVLDPDREVILEEETDDVEQIMAIKHHDSN